MVEVDEWLRHFGMTDESFKKIEAAKNRARVTGKDDFSWLDLPDVARADGLCELYGRWCSANPEATVMDRLRIVLGLRCGLLPDDDFNKSIYPNINRLRGS